jgi:hypothetical protein
MFDLGDYWKGFGKVATLIDAMSVQDNQVVVNQAVFRTSRRLWLPHRRNGGGH